MNKDKEKLVLALNKLVYKKYKIVCNLSGEFWLQRKGFFGYRTLRKTYYSHPMPYEYTAPICFSTIEDAFDYAKELEYEKLIDKLL